jgi:protein-tyrosine kinase
VSKIEEALKKAKNNSKRKNESPSESNLNANNIRSGNNKSIVKLKTSSQIKLMKEQAGISDEELNNKSLIIQSLNQSKITDSFRNLRTQLLKNAKDENFVVLITSCTTGTDSSFVSMNLAAAFAFDESKTSLVIDCDINTQHMEDMLSLDHEYGLLDFLEDKEVRVNDILHDIGIRRLRVIPSGSRQSNECEYFTTERMKVLLDGLVERYQDRYVVLNSPPLSESADTSILIDLVDYVVVVVPYGSVSDSDLDAVLSKIDKSKLLGVILNDVPDWK